jgi:transcriptional regulator with XRE-family HTH domain
MKHDDEPEFKGSLGLNVKLYRTQRNLPQKDLAEQLGVSVNYVSLIESGKRYPSLKVIFKIAEILNVSPGDLLEEDPLQEELVRLTSKYNLDNIIEKLNKIARTSQESTKDNDNNNNQDCEGCKKTACVV